MSYLYFLEGGDCNKWIDFTEFLQEARLKTIEVGFPAFFLFKTTSLILWLVGEPPNPDSQKIYKFFVKSLTFARPMLGMFKTS